MWYKYVYEFLFQTEPLFNDFFLDWLLPTLIVFLLYDYSFRAVGNLYRKGLIRGRDMGSIIHWGIRYGLMWLTVRVLIFFRDNWSTLTLFLGFVLVFFMFISILKSQKPKY